MTEFVVAVISALVGGLCTIAAVFIQRGRKVITYGVSSIPLLRFKPLDNIFTISVDKSVLSGNLSEKGTFEQIDNAFGFQVTIFNGGNEDIEKPNIEIQLDKTAKIIGYEILPSSRPGYEIAILRDISEANKLRILVPFINKREKVLIRLISTGNSDRECNISVLGLGIKSRKERDNSIIIAAILFLDMTVPPTLLFALPGSFWLSIGGYFNSRHAVPPGWMYIPWFVSLVAIFTLFFWSFWSRFRRSKIKGMMWEEEDSAS
jgi:hypothetical protein